MEIIKNVENKETLILTNRIFYALHKKVINHFFHIHNIKSNYKETQLYGFGNYDEDKPNIREDLQILVDGYINGKYLYNKNREATAGKPLIKISREYRHVLFNYPGYKNVYDFVRQDFIKKKDRKEQLSILNKESNIEDYFYVCYYYGEDKKMNKGQVIIYKQWKTVEVKYLYEDESGKIGIYSFFGTIIKSEDYLYFNTKFFVGSKKHEGAKFFFFVGKSAPHERKFLIGTYTGFDKYGNTIAGKMILKKFDSRDCMEAEVNNKNFDPIFSQELSKRRIIVESVVKKNPLLFSAKSPYAKILHGIAQTYKTIFKRDDDKFEIILTIEKSHLNIKCPDKSLIIDDDQINLLGNGQIINLEFAVSGLFNIQKVSLYIKSSDLLNKESKSPGEYTAVDFNNNIISGKVSMEVFNLKES